MLAEPFLTGGGWIDFPVYTFSDDQWYGTTTTCGAIAACARAWPAVLTSDSPGARACQRPASTRSSCPAGLRQVTWCGQPLYLFSNEQAAPTANGGFAPLGNGNNITAFGGTFHLVYNP